MKVQILFGGNRSKKQLEQMAADGREAFWYVPKLMATGDTALFYIDRPTSAIIAAGKTLSRPKATKLKWYEAKVGKVRLLNAPIKLAELRAMFPDWAWLLRPRQFAYVTPERARALLKRCELKSPPPAIEAMPGSGAGFGDAETNALVERAAVKKAIQHLAQRGFKIRSREKDGVGYDLDATKGRIELHVEVKGVSGDIIRFPITQKEVATAKSDPFCRLMVVTSALTRHARVHEFHGRDVKRHFVLEPLSYLAAFKDVGR